MKSTRVFRILSIALAAAVVFYFLVQGVRYLTNPYATTRVYTSTTVKLSKPVTLPRIWKPFIRNTVTGRLCLRTLVKKMS